MRKIGPKNSKQELRVRELIMSLGYKFISHDKNLPGKPDFSFPKYKRVIFVNGCFWHGHKKCKRAKLPLTNRLFWRNKIEINIIKDKKTYISLRRDEWKYLIIWQCEIQQKNIQILKNKIKDLLRNAK
jgi:DNA mismatch endonuclease (patch repair protein)